MSERTLFLAWQDKGESPSMGSYWPPGCES